MKSMLFQFSVWLNLRKVNGFKGGTFKKCRFVLNYAKDGLNFTEVIFMYDIVIIGAGTAGLSAAIYGVRARKNSVSS